MKKYIIILLALTITLSSAKFESRIIGGQELNSISGKEFIVGVGTKFDSFFQAQCAGTLIDKWHVVTAAHCAVDQELYIFAKYHIMPEKQLMFQDPESITPDSIPSFKGVMVKVSRVFSHNDFKADGVSDIALLKLEKPIEISNYAKLPTKGLTEPLLRGNKTLEVLGWGITSPAEQMTSDKLKTINIKALTPEQCAGESFLSRENDISLPIDIKTVNTTICAGGLTVGQENQGACQGDSGGPLVHNSSNGPVLVGVVSSGSGPCTTKDSGRYTKVETFLDFIAKSKEGQYESSGILRKGYIQSLPSGYSLVGTENKIDASTTILSNDIQVVYAYDSKNRKWKQFNINNGVAPANLNISPKSGFWIYKK